MRRTYPKPLNAAPAAVSDAVELAHVSLPSCIRVVSGAEALDVIHHGHALVKNIETVNPSAEPRFVFEAREPKTSFTFYLEQMRDLVSRRPKKKLAENANRKIRFNFQKRDWDTRDVNETQGAAKPGATHTKKTATSLLPPDGRMHFFEKKYGVLLVFDARQCNVKPDFIFPTNIGSNDKKWIGIGADIRAQLSADQLPVPTTLAAIRESHQKIIESRNAPENEDTIPQWNEIVCGVSSAAFIAVAAPENDLFRRLNIQYRRLIARRELNIDVALLIITPQKGAYEYTEAMQLQDLANAKILPPDSIGQDFYRYIVVMNPEVESKLPSSMPCIDIFQAIRQHDVEMIKRVLDQNPGDITRIHDTKTPIQLAAELEFWDCVLVIARAVNTNLNDTAQYGSVLLDVVRENKQTAVALALVKAGASLWQCGRQWRYPFSVIRTVHFAIQHDNLVLLEAMLKKHGAHIANRRYSDEVTLLQFALDHKRPESVALLLNFGAIPSVEAAVFAAEHKKWDAIFVSFNAIIANDLTCSEMIGKLLPMVVLQKNFEAQRTLTGILVKLTCRSERKLFEENESAARQRIVDENTATFKGFFELTESMKLKKETTEKIIQLQKEMKDHLVILSNEIDAKPAPSTAQFFVAKIADFVNTRAYEQKVAQQHVLQEILYILSMQLASGKPRSEVDISKFESLLRRAKDGSDETGNKTSLLITRAQALMKMPCSRKIEAVPVAAAAQSM